MASIRNSSNQRSIFYKSLNHPSPFLELWRSGGSSFKWALLDGELKLRLEKGREAVFACLEGSLRVGDGERKASLSRNDLLYLSGPLDLWLEGRNCLIVSGEGPSDKGGEWLVRKFDDLKPLLVGSDGYRRYVYTALGVSDPSASLLAGFTEGFQGEWTSFPPHKHDDKVEVYVYYGLGDGLGVQIVEDEDGVDAYPVRDHDAVVILRGYHPNVATPGSRICYCWILCQVSGAKSMNVKVKPGFERFQSASSHLTVTNR